MYQSNIYEYLESLKENKLLICNNDKEAIQIRDVATFLGYETFVLPDIRVSPGDDLRPYGEELKEMFVQLHAYHQASGRKLLVSPLRSLLFPLPKAIYFQTKHLEFG
jgi:transcription-repair coupling factor (superfamily II helicase)